jgi:geranylgeranylglycerol-phosphate geranylgeranyltransferase
MNKLAEVLKLTRIEHSLLLVIAVLAAEIIAKGLPAAPALALSLMTPIFISMGAFAINDYYDVKVDKANKKMRPLVTKTITMNEALYITYASMIVGVTASALINWYCFVIALVFAILALLYSYKLKELLFSGNAYIAASMVIPFIFGNYVVSMQLSYPILIVSMMIFFSGLAREIHGTIRDYSGDIKVRDVNSIPSHIGLKNSAYLAAFLYLVAIMISVYLFVSVAPFKWNPVFAIMILVVDLALAYVSLRHLNVKSKRYYGLTRNLSLAAMGLALFAILISSFVS